MNIKIISAVMALLFCSFGAKSSTDFSQLETLFAQWRALKWPHYMTLLQIIVKQLSKNAISNELNLKQNC
jgi:hypothetical protein